MCDGYLTNIHSLRNKSLNLADAGKPLAFSLFMERPYFRDNPFAVFSHHTYTMILISAALKTHYVESLKFAAGNRD